MQELYWRFLAAGVALAAAGIIFLREPVELGLQLAGASLATLGLLRFLW